MTRMVFELQATTNLSGFVNLTTASNAITRTSGVMYLGSSLWSGCINAGNQNANFFVIPKGNTFRIHQTKIYGGGNPATVSVQQSKDYGSNFNVVASDNYNPGVSGAAYDEYVIKHTGKPLEIKSFDGNVIIQFTQNTLVSSFTLVAEYVCEMVENELVPHFYPHS